MRWISLIIPISLIGLSAVIWRMDSLPFRASAQPPAHASNRRPLSTKRKIFAAGVVEGANRQVPLQFEIAGRLTNLFVVEGSRVRKGEPLARLDDAALKQTLAEAESKLALAQGERERLINGSSDEARELARADARLAAVRVDQAKADLVRATKAYRDGAVTPQDLETQQYRLKAARAEWARALARVAEVGAKARTDELKIANARVLSAKAAVAYARVMLAKTVLRAPGDGLVLRVDAEPGEMSGPDSLRPVIMFVDDALIQVRAYVEELDALRLHIGQHAEIAADGLPEKRYAGKIVWVAPSMQPKTVLHQKPGEHFDVKVREVRILIDDPQRLVFGLPVEVFIEPFSQQEEEAAVEAERKARRIPSAAQPPATSQEGTPPEPNAEGR